MPKVTGSLLELSTSKMSLNTLKALHQKVNNLTELFERQGLSITSSGDLSTGTFEVLSDAEKSSTEMIKLKRTIAGMMKARKIKKANYNLDLNDTEVISEVTRGGMNSARHAAGLRAYSKRNQFYFKQDPKTKRVKTMYRSGDAQARNLRSRYIKESNRIDQDKRYLQIQKMSEENIRQLENTPGNPFFNSRIGRNLQKRSAANAATLAWAKQNKKNPLAKAILKANKSRGAKMLDKAGAMAGKAALSAMIGAITTAVGAMVKYLSLLPGIGSNIHKMATKGTMYNLDTDVVSNYEGLSKKLGMENANSFLEAMGAVHSKLASITNGDLDFSVTKLAELAALSGGTSITEAVNYYTKANGNPEAAMKAVLNDTMRASFNHITLQGRTDDAVTAYSRNRQAGEAAYGMGSLMDNLFYTWDRRIGDTKKQEIADKMKEDPNADFLDLLIKAVGNPITARKIAGGADNDRAEGVTKSFEELKQTYESVRDGVLIKILALLEPISDWLRSILKGVLKFLDEKVFKGQFTEILYAMDAEDAAHNAATKENALQQMQLIEYQVKAGREKYGLVDNDSPNSPLKMARRSFEKGIKPENMTWEQAREYFGAEKLYEYLTKLLTSLGKDAATLGDIRVSGGKSADLGAIYYSYVSAAGKKFTSRASKVFTTHGTDPEHLLAMAEGAEEYIQQLSDILLRIDNENYDTHDINLNRSRYNPFLDTTFDDLSTNIQATREWLMTAKSLSPDLQRIIESYTTDGRFNARNFSQGLAVGNRESAEDVQVRAKTIEAVGQQMGESFIEQIKSGTLKFHGVIEAEKRELTIKIEDMHGKTLAYAEDVSKPSVRVMSVGSAFNNPDANIEASSKVPIDN